ncbi:MAG: DsbA family protein, partial [Wolbachia pipientis]|nr:DsbA family protein [Wolbachia pipientis]
MILRLLFILIFMSVNSYAVIKQDLVYNGQYTTQNIGEITPKELLLPLSDDKLLGDPEAPILMIEYASLTCYHCYLFHKEVFPEVKKKYI